MRKHAKSWDVQWVIVRQKQPRNSGICCHQYIGNALLSIQIFGKPMLLSCLRNATKLSAKKRAKPATLNASTTPFDNGFPGLFAKHFPSQRNLNITRRPSGILYITTMPHSNHPYYRRTTLTSKDIKVLWL